MWWPKMLYFWCIAISFVVIINLNVHTIVSGELTPPYFNLATGRKIYASATCGEGVEGPELYCKLVGANTEHDHIDYSVIQGQVCDYCDSSVPEKNHAAEYAIDGTEAWWMSPPLSRGMKYNEVNLTIDFGQEFHVAYLFIRMGNSPRPGLWTLEKSSDYGKTWSPWQHFSDTPADCETYFGKDTYKPITNDDDVICTTEYSKIVPLENGEIPVMLLNDRPSSTNYFNSTVLQEWTRATNVRIRLLRTKNLLGHLMSMSRQDPTVTRRYFYSIKDISIGGRCMCNGHADTCDVLDPKSPVRILACRCQHDTCGIQCNECCPGFLQKRWRQNTNARPFECEPCNCHGHTSECIYDEEIDRKGLSLDIHGDYSGGGVCKNCQHNTEGINCNKCKERYYRPAGRYWNETNVCKPCACDFFYSTGHCEELTGRCECKKAYQPPNCDSCAYGYYGYPNCKECECNLNGTDGYHCKSVNGECPCKYNFAGKYCKQCAEGFYGFPECKACDCNKIGAISDDCDLVTGKCKCLSSFGGGQCERCKHGYYDYPKCQYCDCDNQGTEDEVCNKQSGQCICREGFGGARCDQCLPGYYNYPECTPCNCSITGSTATTCDNTGKCNCLPNFAGKQCTQCSAGFFSYPECLPCNCDPHGSEGVTCNADGQCLCLSHFDGKLCDSCKEGFYNFPSCEDCNCDPAGVIDKFAGCGSVPVGELCECKERVTGRICNECKPLYWNLNISNPDGCETCDCWTDGTLATLDTCESKTGQCTCKPHTSGRTCRECSVGTYDLDAASLFGCKPCSCDVGGTQESGCDTITGQCKCYPRITGRACTQPLTTHYFPTLHQFQYEFEDGAQLSGAQVRYEYNEDIFPGFSSRGYAVFNDIQNEIRNEVTVFKSEVYRVIIRYVNNNPENVTASILIQSENPLEVDQNIKIRLRPTTQPQFATVAGPKGIKPSAIVLDPGKYVFTTKASNNIMLDYFALLPSAYYEASILTRKILTPCELGNMELCRHYKYPSLQDYSPQMTPFVTAANGTPHRPQKYYNEPEHLANINHVGDIPVLNSGQPHLKYNIDIPYSGRYIFVVDYVSEINYAEPYFIKFALENNEDDYGSTQLYPCLYSMACRTPIIDENSREKVFYLSKENPIPVVISTIEENTGDSIPIVSVTAIPVHEYSIDFINPSPVCVIHNRNCVNRKFPTVPDSKRIEFETDHEDRISLNKPPYAVLNERVKLVQISSRQNSTIMVESTLPERKRYVIVVKYYQPDHAKFQVLYNLQSGKNQFNGKFDVKHCPASAGCLGVVYPLNSEDWWFDLDTDFKLSLTNIGPNMLWLDYVLVVPVSQYNDDLLQEETFDQTEEFIKNCGQEHFHITHNASEFCKQAVFSLTAGYNGGALPCSCSDKGSTSFECHPFGGQCQCKPNVIGRQCDACRTGYYGFPDCKPCDCPITAMCEPNTGECVCPPNVMGELCDKCMPNTYGFHQIIGCELCNCAPQGIINGQTQCDMFNGSCVCRPNIEGRACDKCQSGYFDYPMCDKCSCNTAGTELEICDKYDGSCMCKKNVVGRDCDECVSGTYNLQSSNAEGCTTCFCFGKTSRCESYNLPVYNVSLLPKINVNIAHFHDKSIEFEYLDIPQEELLLNETSAQLDFMQLDLAGGETANSILYFGALDYLLNQKDHISAYGGELVYSLFFSTGLSGKPLFFPDVVLLSKRNVLVHYSYDQPSSNQKFLNRVQIIESNFQTQDGKPVTRAEFMMVLRELDMIFVRANYWEQTIATQLSDIYLTMADDENMQLEQGVDYKLLAVERCQCPPGYDGLSCQDCAPGYYRDPVGPYGGYCIKCECHGHSDTCDCATGICSNCQHSTLGDHCEQCIEGYYGNATDGTPHDCMICACPLPYDSNNFATSCEISESGQEIHCECKPGYTGASCESCANGFYGDPERVGDHCKPCDCSGNIDINESGSCDTRTGECLRCLNNTYGTACNLCAPGFYGDAINAKNCRSCDCQELGTLSCDASMGECRCHGNVIGNGCDRCAPDHYGYDSGVGCRACECALASNDTQCDYHTGNCACKPGVTGRQCDRCAFDHWNYTAEGCTPCRCNEGYSRGIGCNPFTGKCECLPNVIGDRCDACPHRSVLIKEEGCFECDVCHGALLDVTDGLRFELDPVILEFDSVAFAYFTSQKLHYYDQLTDEIAPQVSALDPKSVNLEPSQHAASAIESEIKQHAKQSFFVKDSALESSLTAAALLINVTALSNETRHRGAEAREAIGKVESLSHNLAAAASSRLEAAFDEAKNILQRINDTKIDLLPNDKLLHRAQELLDEVDTNMQPIKAENQTFEALKNDIGDFSDKLEDLYLWSVGATNKSYEVDTLNLRNKMALKNSQFELVAEHEKTSKNNIEKAGNYLINGDLTLETIDNNLGQLHNALKNLKDINENIDGQLPVIEDEQKEVAKLTDEAELAAAKLSTQALHLTDQYAHMTANAEPAIKAATAYSVIADAVFSASLLAAGARDTASNATGITEGLEERARLADKNSGDLLQKAQAALLKVQSELEPRLNTSSAKVNDITDMNDNTEKRLKEINIIIEQLPADTLRDTWKNSNNNATDALAVIEEVIAKLEPVVKHTPGELQKARALSWDIDVTKKDISQISNQVESVSSGLSTLNDLAEKIADDQQNVENIRQSLSEKVEELKHQIDAARQIANDIKVGVHFTNSTVLELKAPETLPLLAAKSKISAFFNTEKPNGFLIYLGNDNNNKTTPNAKSNDYLALEIANGYPVLVYDLGNGSQRLTNSKYVADGDWYQAIIDRSGSDIKLIIREELDNGTVVEHVQEADLSGPSTIFNVDRNSRLFVGGYPSPNDFTAPDEIESSSFEGDIEDLRIGDEHVGLFNFVYGEDNNHGTRSRNKLLSDERPPTGYRFNGIGYISMKATPYNFRQRSSIQFKFKADKDTKDGLLFYYGRQHHFMSIELIDGGIFFRFQLGDMGMVFSGTPPDRQYNDNEWHRVVAERDGRRGLLKVDEVLIFQEEAPAQADELIPNVKHMYFGGTPGLRNNTIIMPQNFEGCIDDVTIAGTKVDLGQHVNAVGVKPGCPPKFATTLSFAPHHNGYLRSSQINANNDFHLQLSFRTRQPEGILFYATNHNQSSAIALTMNEGHLSLRSMGSEIRSDQRPLDDGEDHIVTVRHIDNELRLTIDETEVKSLDSFPEPLIIQGGDIFFGGLPKNFIPQRKALATLAYFVGCISDVTINGEIINFADSTEKSQGNTHTSGCPADLLGYEPDSVPIYYPDGTSKQYDAETNVPLAPFNYVPPPPTNAPETTTTTTRRTTTTTTTVSTTASTSTSTTPSPFNNNEIDGTDADTLTAGTPKPKPMEKKKEGCALPANPNFDVDFEEAGYRFAVIKDQRLEITPSPPVRMKKHYDISMSFRTSNSSGMLFYAADSQHNDYIAVFLQRGLVIYSVRIGTIAVTIESNVEVDDMNWHNIQFVRNNKRISLWLDNTEQEGSLEMDENQVGYIMSVEFPVYVGGVPKGMEQLVRKNIDMDEGNNAVIKVANGGFPYYSGCIRDIKVNNALKKPNIFNVVPCSENVEHGLFFNKPNSYIKLYDSFNVSTDFSMHFDFKPREPNGMLFSVHGKHAYMILELVDNHLSFTVKSDAKNKVHINYTLPDGGNFCDGQWRNVVAVKSKFVITISVQGIGTNPGIGAPDIITTNTHRPLFLGGHQVIHKVPGLQTRKGFVGCIRNVQVNKSNVKISSEQIFGDVWRGVCPLN